MGRKEEGGEEDGSEGEETHRGMGKDDWIGVEMNGLRPMR